MRNVLVASLVLIPLVAGGSSDPARAADPSIEGLAWMAGRWAGEQGPVKMEEVWMAPRAGVMLGLHRDTSGERLILFEFLRIEAGEGGIDYIASPRGKPGVPFRLVSIEARRAVFENPDHDFPQRIIYRLGEDGALHARIEGEQGGKASSAEWRWDRVAE